jgi:7,8-dihydropterin-6-yl-methyl-4-(beta-D-ribofuranosyl)aminobenzene 5'-phosphate synthase
MIKGSEAIDRMKVIFAVLVFAALMVCPTWLLAGSQYFEFSQKDQVVHDNSENAAGTGLKEVSITVLYDNNPYQKGLETGWGFSCVIRGTEKTILFDTGGDGSILLRNMQKLGISPLEIDLVVISHIHGDHVGGLYGFLEENPEVIVYIPESFPEGFKEAIKDFGAKLVEISGPARICEHVYSTGLLGTYIKEESLVIDTDKGAIIITGCAHPGVVRIVDKVRELFPDDVRLVMGGFHLLDETRNRLEKIISRLKALGVRYVGPCHCSGDLARELFHMEYRQNYINVGVGKVIAIKDLE